MKELIRGIRNVVLTFGGLVLCVSCGSTSPTHYYQLHALPSSPLSETQPLTEKPLMVGLGPVEIPSYVDRAQLVIRVGEAKLERLEFDHWAEPLSHNLTRVLVENVSQLLSDRGIVVLRWDEGPSLDYRIRIELTQFDMTQTGHVFLVARWIISETGSQDTIAIQTSRFSSSGRPGDYSALISEMSSHVKSLSHEMVNVLILHLQ